MSAKPPRPSSSSSDRLSVATTADVVFVRVEGVGTLHNSTALRPLLERMQQGGFRKFVFDLADCKGMDSTFMGIVLGVALARSRAVVVNAGPDVRELLAGIGIDRLVSVRDQPLELPADLAFEVLDGRTLDAKARLRQVVSAHENLVRLSEENARKFGPFLEAIAREMDGGEP